MKIIYSGAVRFYWFWVLTQLEPADPYIYKLSVYPLLGTLHCGGERLTGCFHPLAPCSGVVWLMPPVTNLGVVLDGVMGLRGMVFKASLLLRSRFGNQTISQLQRNAVKHLAAIRTMCGGSDTVWHIGGMCCVREMVDD